MIKKILFINLLFGVYLCAGTINIAVAANVSYAMQSLKDEFNRLYPNVNVRVTLGSSGKLTAQIKNGAPYSLFMSANMKYPEALYQDGVTLSKPRVYAQGALAYLSVKEEDFSQGIALVKNRNISKIAIANPKTAPYGHAAVEAMRNGGVFDDVKKKFVYAESASQTVSYAVTAADLGFIAKSSLYSPKMSQFKRGHNWAEVDARLYTPINQGVVLLKKGEDDSDAQAFYDFILSDTAAKIFIDFGYTIR
ncbi:MAG: molybdate ABC transporter substrate-binding protein [Campylobacterota bacterium]|nr:molybdate ABC transporter substrate-binding protein [Campylobacterota bacterium]